MERNDGPLDMDCDFDDDDDDDDDDDGDDDDGCDLQSCHLCERKAWSKDHNCQVKAGEQNVTGD